MRKGVIALGLTAVLLAAGLAVLVSNPDAINVFRGKEKTTDGKAIARTAVVFVRHPYKDDYNVLRIPGYVDNIGKREIARIDLEIQLYEGEARKEKVLYSVENIKAGRRKSFDANAGTLDPGRTAKVKVTAIEVYK